MKTFLQICQDTLRESGISGAGPVTVTATKPVMEYRIINWVRQAWLDIQEYRDDWPWMRKEFTLETVADKQRYTLADLGLGDMEKWDFSGASIYKTADGRSGENILGSTTYDNWWNFHRVGERQNANPALIFTDPTNDDLLLFPTPDDVYTISLRYHRMPQILVDNTDVPLLPTNNAWLDIIKWRALWYYAFYDNAPELLEVATERYDSMLHALDNRYGSDIAISIRPIA